MSIPPIITFFNNKGGVGKTTLVYHVAWAFAELLGKRVLAVDLDPQANLTSAFLTEDEIDVLWNTPGGIKTIFQYVKQFEGIQGLNTPQLQKISENLYLVAGDSNLSRFEDTLSDAWGKSLSKRELYRSIWILSSFWQVAVSAAKQIQADVIFIDVGPNLGSINRSALIATDYVAIPLGADLFSLQGLINLGPTLNEWRTRWSEILNNWSNDSNSTEHKDFMLPTGRMESIGYLCQQYGVRLDRPVKAYDKWVNKIPNEYKHSILNDQETSNVKPENDNNCLATIKHYRSLIPLAQEHRKPIFLLTSADGAIGAHAAAVQSAKEDFTKLATDIALKMGVQ